MRLTELDGVSDQILDELRNEIGLEDDEVAFVLLGAYQKLDTEKLPDWMKEGMNDES